jgi:hypothetical protein
VTSNVAGSTSFKGDASSGGSTDKAGTFSSGGNVGGEGNAVGSATSPFLETKTLASGSSGGKGSTSSSITPEDPVVAGDITGTVSGNINLSSNTQFGARTSPQNTGGIAFTDGSLTAGGSTGGEGLVVQGSSTGETFGKSLGVASTTNGSAGGDAAGLLTGTASSTGSSNQLLAPFSGTGGATATFSNNGGASFGTAGGTLGTRQSSGFITAASGSAPYVTPAFTTKKNPLAFNLFGN